MLCDADGTLFPSEEPAYEASAIVTNRLLAELGVEQAYEPSELHRLTNGQNFRSVARLLASMHGQRLDETDLEHWTTVERDVVTAHLRHVLHPDPQVSVPLADLAGRFDLAVVTSSAMTRLQACLDVTDLTRLFGCGRLFSAESSLPRPTSKPDPAVYRFACEQLGLDPSQTVAIEDSVNGVLSAVSAGCWTVGTVQFVPADQRQARAEALRDAGAAVVVASWHEISDLLKDGPSFDGAQDRAGAGV